MTATNKPAEMKSDAPKHPEWCSICAAIPQIIGAIEPISKERKNASQGYQFRGVDDVYSALNLLLAKFGVSIWPIVLTEKRDQFPTKSGGMTTRCILRVQYDLVASDGSARACIVEGEAMDTGDKATQKALSMAYKYMAFQVFCIPTGEKIDTEEDSPEIAPSRPAQVANSHAPSNGQPRAAPSAKALPARDDDKSDIIVEETIEGIKSARTRDVVEGIWKNASASHKARKLNDAQFASIEKACKARAADLTALNTTAAQ